MQVPNTKAIKCNEVYLIHSWTCKKSIFFHNDEFTVFFVQLMIQLELTLRPQTVCKSLIFKGKKYLVETSIKEFLHFFIIKCYSLNLSSCVLVKE